MINLSTEHIRVGGKAADEAIRRAAPLLIKQGNIDPCARSMPAREKMPKCRVMLRHGGDTILLIEGTQRD